MLHGTIPVERFLPYLSWQQIAALPERDNAVVVLPAGAVEQHGLHLPCAVDSLIAEGVVGHALARLPAAVPAFSLPTLAVGYSDEHLGFPGTLSVGATTLLEVVTQIGESVWRSGFRKLLIVNAHGGQPQVMELAARELRVRHADFIVVPHDLWRVPHAAGRHLSDSERALAMHAGHKETALMLALAPQLVRMDQAVAQVPAPFACPTLSPTGRPAAAWTAHDFGPAGVVGDPRGATAEQGREILDSLADSWARAITELHALRWPERSPD